MGRILARAGKNCRIGRFCIDHPAASLFDIATSSAERLLIGSGLTVEIEKKRVLYDGDKSIVAACLIKLLLVVAFMSVDPGDLKCEGEIHASFP